ncbi:hypothetical protein [Sphaerobacter thermophilus]|jgi:hypothetical protein|uniref:hypothetical protein n=1 Tax=Sphaerobacter thermophilus TaxID=2057 RepID=UPI0039C47DE1
MPAEVRLELNTIEAERRISVRSFLSAVQASVDLLHELDRPISGGRLEWYFTELGVGSGIAVLAPEWIGADDDAVSDHEIEVAEQRVVERFVDGLAALDERAEWPESFSMDALQAALRIVDVMRDGIVSIRVSTGRTRSVELTERVIANVKDLIGERYTVLGSVEGQIETVSVARGRRYFSLRDEVEDRAIRCAFAREQFPEVRLALGRRVSVAGELAYSRVGQLVGVRSVTAIRLLDERTPPSVNEITGIAPEFTDHLPSEDFLNQEDG